MIGWVGLIALALGGVGLAYWYWSKKVAREVAESAKTEWGHLQETDPELLSGIDQTQFQEIFHRVEFPRAPAYLLLGFGAVILATPFILAAVNLVTVVVESLSGDLDLPVYMDWVKGFYILFATVGGWVLVASYFIRRFHTRRPGSLREEILRRR